MAGRAPMGGRRYDQNKANLLLDHGDVCMGSAGYGRGRVDNATKQLRAEGYDEQARVRSEGEGAYRICPHRSCGGSRTGRTVAAADRTLDLWQCQRWHAAHAVGSDNWNRFAAKGAGLAGRIGDHMAFLQRSELARKTP